MLAVGRDKDEYSWTCEEKRKRIPKDRVKRKDSHEESFLGKKNPITRPYRRDMQAGLLCSRFSFSGSVGSRSPSQRLGIEDIKRLESLIPRICVSLCHAIFFHDMDGMDEQPNKGLPESSGLPSGSIRRAIRAEWLQTKSARVERITERFDPKRK